MTTIGAPTVADGAQGNSAPVRTTSAGARLKRWGAFVDRHPLWTVSLVAAVVRALAVVVLGPLQAGVVVPDEQQYLDLADSVADGRGAEAWQPGYGQSLYDSTAAFMRPLTRLVELVGERQIAGQGLAAVFGVLTAVLTTWLALRVVRVRFAVMAGLLVAAVPSQVFWSSVVLRESMVWAALAAVALAVALATSATSWRRLASCAALAGLGLWALADLRGQTAVVVGAALVLAALVTRSERRVIVPLVALILAIAVPWGAGLGPAGLGYVANVVPQLAVIRTNLSIGADSSFIDRTVVPPAPTTPPAARGPAPAQVPTPPLTEVPEDAPVVAAPSGERYAVDESAGANLSALPQGLVAVTARPFVWEPSRNAGLLMAKIENVVWYVLYLLAVLGALAGWRRRNALAFPVIVTGGIIAVAAISQANLGTAFRHRGQILWALAVLAAVGTQYLVDRRRAPAE